MRKKNFKKTTKICLIKVFDKTHHLIVSITTSSLCEHNIKLRRVAFDVGRSLFKTDDVKTRNTSKEEEEEENLLFKP